MQPLALAASDAILYTALLFCRIGGCLMLMPGFASPRVPMQVRLLLALAVTLVLAPVMLPKFAGSAPGLVANDAVRFLIVEMMIGGAIGLMGRFFFLALHFLLSAVAMMIGYTALPGTPVEDTEPAPPFAGLILLSATLLFFASGQHWEVLQALIDSYTVLPLGSAFLADLQLTRIVDVLSRATFLALKVCGPFVVFAVIVNLLFGIVNKLSQQIPVFFVSIPFIFAGAFFVLLFSSSEILLLFLEGFSSWLRRG